LEGKGAIWYDDAFFGEITEGAGNLLSNPGFEPPASAVYDLAPEKGNGQAKLSVDFENGMLGKVKEIGPDEFYARVTREGVRQPLFLWFHFRVDGCKDREVTIHLNVAPWSKEVVEKRPLPFRPVVSYDGDSWAIMPNTSWTWNEDGTVLTIKKRLTRSTAWLASCFPYTAAYISHFIARQKGNPYFSTSVLGKSTEGRDLRLYTITDPAVPESQKRTILLTTLQHDLETTGAMAVEGICRFLLSADPGAARLRRSFVFYVVPQVDVDGVANGNVYFPLHPNMNMNRTWGLGVSPEVSHVERFVKDLAARGRKVDIFFDFHGWNVTRNFNVTQLLFFGKELMGEEAGAEEVRLAESISARLRPGGQVWPYYYRKMDEYITDGVTDVRRLAAGWMKFEAGARLAGTFEIEGNPECTQEDYFLWGRNIIAGIADFYGLGWLPKAK
jgi:hypothetical protein